MSDPVEEFERRNRAMIEAMSADAELRELARRWLVRATELQYSYHFRWMDRPIIQLPQDMIALQEIIWHVRPEVVVETGVAHGGSIVYYASLLELLGGEREVIGIDVDIRPHNRAALDAHPMRKRIRLVEGSSTDGRIADDVRRRVAGRRCLVVLDSNHTHEHVRRELDLYSPLVSAGSYMVIFDTVVEFMPDDFYPDRAWRRGDNPWTAVQDFLEANDRFEVDHGIEQKLMFTMAPGGFLRCMRDE